MHAWIFHHRKHSNRIAPLEALLIKGKKVMTQGMVHVNAHILFNLPLRQHEGDFTRITGSHHRARMFVMLKIAQINAERVIVAVIAQFTGPNHAIHLDWHGTFGNYVAAKSRIFKGMAGDSVLAYNAHDGVVVDAVAGATCALVPCSGVDVPRGGNGVNDGRVMINGHAFDAPTSDPSFLFDLVAAGTLAMAVGASADGVDAAIGSFVPGAHRRQVVDTCDGIRWIDDSKATNPHATSAAVAAHQPVILLAGGQNKGLDLSSIGRLDGIETLIAFGAAGPLIGRSATVDAIVVDSLEAAVAQARNVARSGDTVLLSPGCTSFDEFTSYAERGDEFHRLVKQMKGTPA